MSSRSSRCRLLISLITQWNEKVIGLTDAFCSDYLSNIHTHTVHVCSAFGRFYLEICHTFHIIVRKKSYFSLFGPRRLTAFALSSCCLAGISWLAPGSCWSPGGAQHWSQCRSLSISAHTHTHSPTLLHTPVKPRLQNHNRTKADKGVHPFWTDNIKDPSTQKAASMWWWTSWSDLSTPLTTLGNEAAQACEVTIHSNYLNLL